MNIRLKVYAVLLTLAFTVLVGRVSYLVYRQYSPDTVNQKSLRGPVTDRRGITLALTEEASTIGIAPEEIIDPEFTAAYLAEMLDMPQEKILERIYFLQNRKYFLLKRQVDNFTAHKIMQLKLPGVYREYEYRRVYPSGSLAANLIGFVGRDGKALAGLELDYSEAMLVQPPEMRGPNLSLTIDSLIQYRLEEALDGSFEASGAKRAVGIFMDIETGEVLALANRPTYNPNEYYKSKPIERGNWAIRLNYEPGSTVKVLMASILLNENKYERGKHFHCDGKFDFSTGQVRCRSGGKTIAHGDVALPDIIEKSCNVGIIQAMKPVESAVFYEYLKTLGLGNKTGILPAGSGETSGYLPELSNWVESNSYYYPIGQGFSVTPVQLIQAMSVIGTGGEIVQPYIMKRIVSEDKVLLDETIPNRKQTQFRPEVLREVRSMMRLVVEKGTGRRAQVDGISLIGKTGTGQKSSARGYMDRYAVSFVGMFPEENPKYLGMILFDDVGGGQSGGTTAGPVFAQFLESIKPLISQTSEYKTKTLQRLDVQIPDYNHNRMPNLLGMSSRAAVSVLNKNFETAIELRGSGYVFKQEPEPGTPLSDKKVILYLAADPVR